MADDIDYETLGDHSTMAANAVAGALAGIAEHAVMFPVDSIKTRMQIIQPARQVMYSGVMDAVTTISTTEGARTLWRGVNSVVLGAGPSHALYFATYEYAKEAFGGNSRNGYQFIATGAAGACATVVSDALMNPFDVVKQRMQVQGSTHANVFECARKLYTVEGLAAFYISYPTTLTMTVPFQSIQFATYEYFRRFFNPSGRYDPKTHVVAGGLAGALAAAATTPLDVCKTLLQTRGNSSDLRIRNANGLMDAARIIYERHGPAGFFRGIRPRILSHFPSTAISWSVYEYFKWFLHTDTPRVEGLLSPH